MNTPTSSVWRNKPAINTRLTILAISLACAVSALPLDVRAQAQATSINLPVQPLSKSLLQLGQQASVQIFFSQELVDGHQAPALSGSYSPEQALQQLLAGTGITYKRKGNTISLTPDPASSVAELSTITVKGGILGDLSPAYVGGQVATGGSLGLLGSVDVMDNPFSTTNYTSELLYDQQARTLADVVVNDAAVRTTTSTGGFGEDFVIRGFAVGSGDVSVNGLYSLVSSSRVPVQILERVEVLKGPGTLMRGIPPGGSIGGAINLVTKRAEDEPLTRVTASYVSQANVTAQLDVDRKSVV